MIIHNRIASMNCLVTDNEGVLFISKISRVSGVSPSRHFWGVGGYPAAEMQLVYSPALVDWAELLLLLLIIIIIIVIILIWPLDVTLTLWPKVVATLAQSEPGSRTNEGVLHYTFPPKLQNWSFPIRCGFVSYQRHPFSIENFSPLQGYSQCFPVTEQLTDWSWPVKLKEPS